MNKELFIITALLLPVLLSVNIAFAQSDTEERDILIKRQLQEVIVTETRTDEFEIKTVEDQVIERQSSSDISRLMKMVPGGNTVINGTLTGQAQYRGMFGPRVNTVVDGMYINPGGPNWMDPPLHYIPMSQLGSFEVIRGIAPVSSGFETIGGTVIAERKNAGFTTSEKPEFHTDLITGVRSADDSFYGGGIVSVSNDTHRFQITGSSEYGDDIRFGDGGMIKPTEHERHNYGGEYGLKLGGHEFTIGYNRNDTGDSGTPALPMDIIFVDTNIFKTGYSGSFGKFHIRGKVYYSEVDHLMDNFSLRRPPDDQGRYRFTRAESEGLGYSLQVSFPVRSLELTMGADGHRSEHNADIFNPNNDGFFVNNFNNAERNLYGFYLEVDYPVVERLDFHAGARYTRVNTDSGEVDLSPNLPPPAQRLAEEFNSSDRSRSDNNIDLVAKLNYSYTDNVGFVIGAARKTRSPSYIERYAWLPTQATAGLADGNNYVGDIDLDPEVSYEVEGGVSFTSHMFYFYPRVFYRYVDDYIQGTPATDEDVVMVSSGSGDPDPLRFSNVEAEFFGFDAEGGVYITDRLTLNGIINFVRAKRKDIDDNLYRIAPLNGMTSLTYSLSEWLFTAQGIFAADQDKVSETNDETRSDGYAVFNLYGSWSPGESVTLTVGIENIFDEFYTDHLSGINRVRDSDIGVGERIPGPGRNFLASLNVTF